MLDRIYFDESGNSWDNLLDPDQPVSVVASICISEDIAESCLAALRKVTHQRASDEVHFKGLKSKLGQSGILKLLEHTALNKETVKIAVGHKPFAMGCRLVDLTVEPMWHHNGMNLYASSRALDMANALHIGAPVLSNNLLWNQVLRSFYTACTRPIKASFESFESAISAWHETASQLGHLADELKAASPFLRAELSHGGTERKEARQKDSLDLALPLFVELARIWSIEKPRGFEVVHDHSEIIERWTEVLYNLSQLPDPEMPSRNLSALRIPEGRLNASADSKQHAALQAVDVVAGAVRYWLNARMNGDDSNVRAMEFQQRTADWLAYGIWPDLR